jgi:hypothetical protein
MIKLTKSEWDRMKRPIFPDIQFVSAQNNFQMQSMLKVGEESDTVSYYAPYIRYREINNLEDLINFVDFFKEEGINYLSKYIIDEENDNTLYKVEEDGTN